MDSKICIGCSEDKPIKLFRKNRRKCKKCEYEQFCEWRLNNKDKIKKQSNRYYNKNKHYIKNKRAKLYEENSEQIKEQVKKYREQNPDAVRASAKKYYNKNREKILKYHKQYREENKAIIAAKKKEYEKSRLLKDPVFKLRRIVKNAIYCALVRNGSSKNGSSILNHLPYNMETLRNHIESLFEPWMNWSNWGLYNPLEWDDKDQSTWTWHLDHIIRQADLPYDSFEHPNFKKCWALNNLRPYNAKMNVIENSNRRTVCDV